MNNTNNDSAQEINNQLNQALVVGINNYEYRKLKNLHIPDVNAKNIDIRIRKQFQVERIQKASRKQLKEEIVKLFKPEGQHPEIALLYFSGYVLTRNQGISEIYLATSDSNPSQEYELGVSLRWLKKILQESPVEQQIIILDCCHQQYTRLDLNKLLPGNESGKDRFCIALFHKSDSSFQNKNKRCSELTGAILNELKSKQGESIDHKTLIKRLKGYEKSLKRCGDFKRISFGKPIYLLFGDKKSDHNDVQDDYIIPQDSNNPYKGLAYFDCEDAKYFYGRDQLTDELLEKVREHYFLAIMGASGSGKSSLIRAGLIYQLEQGEQISGSENWKTYIFQPGKNPLQSLAENLNIKVDKLRNEGSEYLKVFINDTDASRVVLVVDQFEEVFSLYKDTEENYQEREKFFECLLGSLGKVNNNKLCLVLGIRADFFGKCAEQDYYGLARKIQQHLIAVTPMNRDELKQAIEKPARQLGYKVEERLVKKLVEDVENEPGSLPLLQYALQELWKRRADKYLTVSAYDKLGDSKGIKGILEKHANQVYESLNKDGKEIAKLIFIRLTRPGDGTGETRSKVSKEKLLKAKSYSQEQINQVIETLAINNLITISEEILDNNQKAEVVNLSHEALIRHWSKLRGWLYINRNNTKLKEDIEEAAKKWKSRRTDIEDAKDYLYRGEELKEAETFIDKFGYILPLTNDALKFIEESQKYREEQKCEEEKIQIREEENQKLRRIILLTVIVGLTFILSLLGFLLFLEVQKKCRFW
ncbi:MAG: caspase family protein [Nostocales cyanobacterium 94392]|nr:caspase family protein [Nostocales cyanobacterium 94392]